MKMNARRAWNRCRGRIMLNWMHEHGHAMHVYESACSKKKSKAEKLNRIALHGIHNADNMNLNAFIEVMLRVN